MSTVDRTAYETELTERYTTEFAFLRSNGHEPHITWTGGTCTALQATIATDRRLLALNGDACLVGSLEEARGEESGDWYIGIYDIDEGEGDQQIAEGFGADLPTAYADAFASLERGDFVE